MPALFIGLFLGLSNPNVFSVPVATTPHYYLSVPELQSIATSSAEKYHLTKKETARMLATVSCESGWVATSTGDYINGQPTSFGLAQFHYPSKWGISTTSAFDPTISLDLMASVWRERHSEWSCYGLLYPS